jgi:tetratricopeptide (TPR) repeat protein
MNEALELQPENVEIQNAIAALYMDMGKPEETQKLVDKVLEKDKGNLLASLLKARLFLRERKTGEAVNVLAAVIKDDPRHAGAHYYLGLAYMAERDRTKAKGAFLKAVEFGPGNLKARILLSEIYLRERAADLALEQLNIVLVREPENFQAHLLQGNAYVLKRDAKSAREAYSKAKELQPDNPIAYYQLATLDRFQGRHDDAMANLNKVLTLRADHLPAMAAKVSLYMARKQPAKALSFLGERISQHEKNPQLAAALHAMRGNLLFVQKDYEGSEAALRKAIDLNPDQVGPYLSLARLHVAQNETPEAIAQYKEILEKQPRFIQAYMSLGTIYETEGKRAEACEMYEKALEINPDFAPAANNLAYRMLQKGQDPGRALNLAKKAKAQLPDDPNVADTLGLAFIAKGLYPSAISELSEAVEKMPQHPTVRML